VDLRDRRWGEVRRISLLRTPVNKLRSYPVRELINLDQHSAQYGSWQFPPPCSTLIMEKILAT
jgi:hypothetical protein